MNPSGALQFLIETIFNLYSYIVFARFLLQLVKADFYNPLSQFTVKATNPLLVPLRKIIPGWKGIDWSSLFLLFIVQALMVLLIVATLGISPSPVSMLITALVKTFALCIDFFVFAIIVQIILSWVAPHQHNPMITVLYQLTEPLLGPARRLIPPVGGLDFSAMIVLLGLYFCKIFFGL